MITSRLTFGILLIATFGAFTEVQIKAQEPIDGQRQISRDTLLDTLSGDWKITRIMDGKLSEHTFSAIWELNHQFLRLHMKDVNAPAPYEAEVFIGYDTTSDRYVAHWLDIFGGRMSETLGYGTRSGNSIRFVFEYPDGPFLNTFTWNPETKTWTFLMQHKNAKGAWVDFAIDKLRRS